MRVQSAFTGVSFGETVGVMFKTVEIPLWLLVLIVVFAAVTFASHFLFPSVRWFFRKRAERLVAQLNQRLARPIEPFKLARRHDMIQRLTYDPDVARAIADHSHAEGVPENVAFELARTYAREIVPSFSASAYFGIGTRGARLLANAIYDVRTGVSGDDYLEQVSPDSTVVFVMNHRSNMDYVLVTYLAAQSSALSYAVGEWARVWPLSGLIRSMGAYFIRRKSRNALYRKVLARYVQMATAGGVTQAVFPEGGLSLNGRLQSPKLGILNYVVTGAVSAGRNVVFVPVGLNYDRVLEDRILVAANQAGSRRFPARMGVVVWFVLRKLWLRLWGRFLRFGYAVVRFGPPLSLNSFGAERPVDELAAELMRRIAEVVPVLPVPLLARVLLKSEDGVSEADLEAAFERELALLPAQKVTVAAPAFSHLFEGALSHLSTRRIIEIGVRGISVTPEQRPLVMFYANSIAHHFATNDVPSDTK